MCVAESYCRRSFLRSIIFLGSRLVRFFLDSSAYILKFALRDASDDSHLVVYQRVVGRLVCCPFNNTLLVEHSVVVWIHSNDVLQISSGSCAKHFTYYKVSIGQFYQQ